MDFSEEEFNVDGSIFNAIIDDVEHCVDELFILDNSLSDSLNNSLFTIQSFFSFDADGYSINQNSMINSHDFEICCNLFWNSIHPESAQYVNPILKRSFCCASLLHSFSVLPSILLLFNNVMKNHATEYIEVSHDDKLKLAGLLDFVFKLIDKGLIIGDPSQTCYLALRTLLEHPLQFLHELIPCLFTSQCRHICSIEGVLKSTTTRMKKLALMLGHELQVDAQKSIMNNLNGDNVLDSPLPLLSSPVMKSRTDEHDTISFPKNDFSFKSYSLSSSSNVLSSFSLSSGNATDIEAMLSTPTTETITCSHTQEKYNSHDKHAKKKIKLGESVLLSPIKRPLCQSTPNTKKTYSNYLTIKNEDAGNFCNQQICELKCPKEMNDKSKIETISLNSKSFFASNDTNNSLTNSGDTACHQAKMDNESLINAQPFLENSSHLIHEGHEYNNINTRNETNPLNTLPLSPSRSIAKILKEERSLWSHITWDLDENAILKRWSQFLQEREQEAISACLDKNDSSETDKEKLISTKMIFRLKPTIQIIREQVNELEVLDWPSFAKIAHIYPNSTLDVKSINNEHQSRIGPVPVILRKLIRPWPACNKWRNLGEFWIQKHGRRCVPVERSLNYKLKGGERQDLIPIYEFLRDGLLGCESMYLAQHDLFHQIPDLMMDAPEPFFVSAMASPNRPVERAIWIGPAGTLSPFHQDPRHNFFCLVAGVKHFKLIRPSVKPEKVEVIDRDLNRNVATDGGAILGQISPESSFFSSQECDSCRKGVNNFYEKEGIQDEYLSDEKCTFNSINDSPDTEYNPDATVEVLEVTLGPGDCLYLPKGWWHSVKGVSASMAVSHWFDLDGDDISC